MNKQQRGPGRYPGKMRERVVRMVLEHQHEHGSQREANSSVAETLGPTPETVHEWVRQAEIDGGIGGGLTVDERRRMRDLEKENRELRRANEILKAASSFFAREFDPRPPR
jgi:transposase